MKKKAFLRDKGLRFIEAEPNLSLFLYLHVCICFKDKSPRLLVSYVMNRFGVIVTVRSWILILILILILGQARPGQGSKPCNCESFLP